MNKPFKAQDTVVCNILGVGVIDSIVKYEGVDALKVLFKSGEWDLYQIDGRPWRVLNENDMGLKLLEE